MPVYKPGDDLATAIELLNRRLYAKAYSFKVYVKDSYTVYVQASFDFGYYVNLHLEFNEYVFTNLNENDEWPQAWSENQLFILDEYEIDHILLWYNVEPLTDIKKTVFGFIFNINGRNVDSKGIVICKELNIRWENPDYNE